MQWRFLKCSRARELIIVLWQGYNASLVNNPNVMHLSTYTINLSLYKFFQKHSVQILLVKRSS